MFLIVCAVVHQHITINFELRRIAITAITATPATSQLNRLEGCTGLECKQIYSLHFKLAHRLPDDIHEY